MPSFVDRYQTNATLSLTVSRPFRHRRRRAGRVHGSDIDDWYKRMMAEQKRISEAEMREYVDEEEDVDRRVYWKDKQKKRYIFGDHQNTWPNSDDGTGWQRMPPNIPGPNPKEGPLEGQVHAEYIDARLTDETNLDHMKYWFTEPRGGWHSESTYARKPKYGPGLFATAVHRGRNRKNIADLKAGDEFRGVVREIWLYHGIKVDIGYDYDGLLPVDRDNWDGFEGTLDVGLTVNVIIEKIWDPEYYRWPIQLTAVNPDVQRFVIPPGEWDPPVDMRGKTTAQLEMNTNRRLPTEYRYISRRVERVSDPERYREQLIKWADSVPSRRSPAFRPFILDALDDAFDKMDHLRGRFP